MLALSHSPPLLSTIGWPLEDPISDSQNSLHKDSEALSEYSFLYQFSSSAQAQVDQVEVERSAPSPAISGDPTMVKKLNHNASERDRRKKINSLYSSLRSLLPAADQMKKLSIPATISRVLKYIPELQQQVEALTKKKEEYLLRISQQGDAVVNKESRRKIAHHNPVCAVSTSRLNESEAVAQISSYMTHKTPLSEILLCLEKDGLLLLNSSSFVTFGERVFYSLHFQVENSSRMEVQALSEKILSVCDKKSEGVF